MSNVLVTYFSASGVTAKVAKNMAELIGADTFGIRPKQKYTDIMLGNIAKGRLKD